MRKELKILLTASGFSMLAAEWGMWETMYWLTSAASAAIGGWVAHTFGFDALFSVMFVLALVGVISASLLLKNHEEPMPHKKD